MRPFGILGYPGAVGFSQSTKFQPLAAQLAAGIVTDVIDYLEAPDAPPESRQWVKSTIHPGSGSSGGPLFLSNGHVASLYSGFTPDSHGGGPTSEFFGIHCVREVMAYHKIGTSRGQCRTGRNTAGLGSRS